MPDFKNFDVVKILRFGLPGLVFLLALLAFWLVKDGNANANIVQWFMGTIVVLMTLAIVPSFLTRVPKAPFDIPGYAGVTDAIRALLEDKPYIYSRRHIMLDFSEESDGSILVKLTWHTVVHNPTDGSVRQPQYYSAPEDEVFLGGGLYCYDESKPQQLGQVVQEITPTDFRNLTQDADGRRKLFQFFISPNGHQVTKLEIQKRTQRKGDCALLTTRIITGELTVVVDYSKLSHPPTFSYERALLPYANIDCIAEGGRRITYTVCGVQLPGNGFILEWR